MRKTKTRHPRHSSTEDEMMSLGLFTSSSSSSSSNLSPLALPFTVERSNHKKLNLNSTLDSQIWPNFHSSPANSTIPNPNNWSSFNSSVKSGLEPINPPPADSSFALNHNNSRLFDDSFYSFPKTTNTPTTQNWSSMNCNIKSGLETVNPPTGRVFGMNPNTQPHTLSFDDDDNDGYAPPLLPLDFDLLPSGNLFHDYGSSHVDNSQSLFGSKYSEQADVSRGKEDSSLFRDRVVRENNIGPSIIGKPHSTSFSTTNHGFVSSGFSKEHTVTWNGHSSYFPSLTKSSPSVVINPPTAHSFSAQGSVSTKSMEISSTSLFNKNNVSVSHNPLKEKGSNRQVDFEFKASSKCQTNDINSSDDVKSVTNLSENLDHHNPGEDSPCWKGASTHFLSNGSQEPESSQHLIKNLQKNSGEDNLLPEIKTKSFDGTMDKSMHETVENVINHVSAESLDVNVVVKALSNLSELLFLNCSKDECGLTEQDYKALDHIISNLNVCISRKTQPMDSAQKNTSPQIFTSNVLPEERNNDHFGKNIEELQNVSLKNDDRSKDYDMIQKIQSVFDENLECKEDLPSDTLLYKNLWLEAEAELCTLSYRGRFHRAKREIAKSKGSVPDVSEVTFDIKNVSSSKFSPIASKPIHEAATGSKTSNTHADNPSFPNVDYHINNVDDSVMARFNILKLRGESNPVNIADKEPADVEAVESRLQQHLGKDSHGNKKMQSSPDMGTEDVEHLVMARWNVLKRRESSKESQSCDIGVHPHFQHQASKDKEAASGFDFGSASADWEHVFKDEFS